MKAGLAASWILAAQLIACSPSRMPASTAGQALANGGLAQPDLAVVSGETLASNSARRQAGRYGSYGHHYGIRPTYEECMTHQADGVSTAGHRQQCADEEFGFQDARLKRLYARITAALETQGDDAAVSELQSAQREWLSQLDDACAAAAEAAGSTMGPAAQSTCFMDRTAQRAGKLERGYADMDEAGARTHANISTGPFDGEWSVTWCDDSRPEADCGGFNLSLVQKGRRLCGSYDSARPGLSQIDEGGTVSGIVEAESATVTIESERSGGKYVANASIHDGQLHWKLRQTLREATRDIDIVAIDEKLDRTPLQGHVAARHRARASYCQAL